MNSEEEKEWQRTHDDDKPYKKKTEENGYLETRSIRDDFHKTLYEHDYTEEEWNNDINFWLQDGKNKLYCR